MMIVMKQILLMIMKKYLPQKILLLVLMIIYRQLRQILLIRHYSIRMITHEQKNKNQIRLISSLIESTK
jgi:hypothetical protein